MKQTHLIWSKPRSHISPSHTNINHIHIIWSKVISFQCHMSKILSYEKNTYHMSKISSYARNTFYMSKSIWIWAKSSQGSRIKQTKIISVNPISIIHILSYVSLTPIIWAKTYNIICEPNQYHMSKTHIIQAKHIPCEVNPNNTSQTNTIWAQLISYEETHYHMK